MPANYGLCGIHVGGSGEFGHLYSRFAPVGQVGAVPVNKNLHLIYSGHARGKIGLHNRPESAVVFFRQIVKIEGVEVFVFVHGKIDGELAGCLCAAAAQLHGGTKEPLLIPAVRIFYIMIIQFLNNHSEYILSQTQPRRCAPRPIRRRCGIILL